MKDVYIIGVGMTPFGKLTHMTVKDLTRAASDAALADAGIARDAIGAAFFGNAGQAALEGQFMVPGEIALRAAGYSGIPIVNVENACASASTALHQAYSYVKAGMAEVVLAIGAEKMYIDDRARMFGVFDGAWDVSRGHANLDAIIELAKDMPLPPEALQDTGQRSVFMDMYANLARFHMQTFGTTQRQIAAVAAKNHHHSTLNPLSQYRNDLSIDEVLASRLIVWPLTLPMCAPISDGAAAAVVCHADYLKKLGKRRAVRIAASVLASGSDRRADEWDKAMCRIAAFKAYEQAGIGPEDVSLAEVHDASAFAEILQTENLGFCAPGEGGHLAASGATSLGGRIPVNPSGGLESKGHPIGATGLGQVFELVQQLRGEAGERQVADARFAIAENGGGFHGYEEAAACITLLARPEATH